MRLLKPSTCLIVMLSFCSASLAGNAPVSDKAEEAYRHAKTAFEFTALEQGVELTKQAAQMGHPEAQTNLSYFYSDGRHIEKDFHRAAYWIEQAASSGDIPAMARMAEMLEIGIGFEQNFERAVKWRKKAAQKGHLDSLFALGRLSFYGEGMLAVPETARRYFAQAAELGHAESYYALYVMRESLFGVDDTDQSDLIYLETASELGFGPATAELATRIEESRGWKTPQVERLETKAREQGIESATVRFDPRQPRTSAQPAK